MVGMTRAVPAFEYTARISASNTACERLQKPVR